MTLTPRGYLLKERRADHGGCTKGGEDGGKVVDPEVDTEVGRQGMGGGGGVLSGGGARVSKLNRVARRASSNTRVLSLSCLWLTRPNHRPPENHPGFH